MRKSTFKIFMSIAILALFSCSNSNIKISTTDNFEKIDLPDGSIAYLNNNSYIEYDKNFTERVVWQNGEVYFKVTKGITPFTVKTDAGEIQVLGTEFNVKSNKKELEVEVEEGLVELKIKDFIKKIEKGQKAFFKKNANSIKIGNAEFKYNKWINKLEIDLKKIQKEISKSSKQIEKDSKKIGKEIKKEFKKLKKK